MERKAPTRTESSTKNNGTSFKKLLMLVIVAVIIVGASVAIGMSGDGAIDVAQVITTRGDQLIEEGADPATISLPAADATPKARNGGLRPYADGEGPPAEPEPEENASTTDETASSTDEVADGEETTDEETTGEEAVDVSEVSE